MKNGKWIGALIVGIVALLAVVLAFKLLTGALSLLHGALDTVLGIALIAALVLIVIWMFRYAAKKKK